MQVPTLTGWHAYSPRKATAAFGRYEDDWGLKYVGWAGLAVGAVGAGLAGAAIYAQYGGATSYRGALARAGAAEVAGIVGFMAGAATILLADAGGGH